MCRVAVFEQSIESAIKSNVSLFLHSLDFQLMKVQHMLLFQLTEPQLKDMLLNVIGVKNLLI